MNKLVLAGIPPYDGEYEFDASYFTMRELNTIKRVAKVRAGELEEALAASDTDVIVAIAVIALERNGITGAEDELWNAQAGQISLVSDDEDTDGDPPTETAGQTSSGGDSPESSALQANDPSPIGSPL